MRLGKKTAVASMLLLMVGYLPARAQQLMGIVVDKNSNDTLIGAIVSVEGSNIRVATDISGLFKIQGLKKSSYNLSVTYIGYKPQRLQGVVPKAPQAGDTLHIAMEPDVQKLKGVVVTAVERRNTDAAMVRAAKNSSVIVSNVSAQEISRTQDTNAGEVIRRVPGVSLIDDKFVMVRGLSQRYNNVWVNGGAVPSSEADSRAFSFDIIPSSQIDNLTIVKSPAAEYPADYSGGFIIVDTKEIPEEDNTQFSVGGNWNTSSVFRNFSYSKGSSWDFLGFGLGARNLSGGINSYLHPQLAGSGQPMGDNLYSLAGNGFNNSWKVKSMNPLGDLKLGASLNRRWSVAGGKLGLLAALNYTNEYRTYKDMENNLYGLFDVANDRPSYLRYSVDDQYNNNVRLGAMLNLTFLSKEGKHKYQLRNIFNQLSTSRYTWREGVSAQSDREHSAEYYYRSRAAYTGQFTGKHKFANDALDWSAGYAYANRYIPDRKRYLLNDIDVPGTIALHTGNDVSREWTQLNEHIFSLAVNDKHKFKFGEWSPELLFGGYGEYRTREYLTRSFYYQWNPSDNNLPSDFLNMDITQLLGSETYMGAKGLYLYEQRQMRNNYRGHNTLGAGYFSMSLPFGKFDVHAGVRFEHNDMELISNTRDYEKSEMSRHYRTDDFFPSVNSTYKFDDKNQMRLSYGRSINRPEFREVSPAVYYDFDIASDVKGNTGLKSCHIDNFDLRYEFYPSRGEVVSLAAFYKHFNSPIEWTYTVAGGTSLTYSYENAKSSDSYGLELDIRKDLSFIGLRGFSWSFNGALIKSRVNFSKGSAEESRPMQGQSPYLVNTGIFYKNEKKMIDVALLYNRIGKRIIGVGRSEGSSASEDNARVPHSYEMPRNVLDLSFGKKWGKNWELKFNVRDILGEKVYYKQFGHAVYSDGNRRKYEEVARSYRPGRNIGVTLLYKL